MGQDDPRAFYAACRLRARTRDPIQLLPLCLIADHCNDPTRWRHGSPRSQLDSLTRIARQSELISLWQRAGFTALLVTDDVEEALLLAGRVIVLSDRPARVKAEIANPRPIPAIEAIRTWSSSAARCSHSSASRPAGEARGMLATGCKPPGVNAGRALTGRSVAFKRMLQSRRALELLRLWSPAIIESGSSAIVLLRLGQEP
jgi:hypothetical protein